MSTPTPSDLTPTRLAVQHRPDGWMTLTVTDLINGTETTTVLDEAERRSLLRAIIASARDVRGYVVLTYDPADPGRYDVNWDGFLYASAIAAEDEARHARSMDQPEAHVGMVLAVLGGPDDQLPARSGPEPARVVDGLTVGARYRVMSVHGHAWADGGDSGATFDGKEGDCYCFTPDPLVTRVRFHVTENGVARGLAVITDLDGNRVDYWGDQARSFVADARAHGMRTPADTSTYEPATFLAIPRVLDEQESTR